MRSFWVSLLAVLALFLGVVAAVAMNESWQVSGDLSEIKVELSDASQERDELRAELVWHAVANGEYDPAIAQMGLAEFDSLMDQLDSDARVDKYPSFGAELRSAEVQDEPIELVKYLALCSLSGYLPRDEVLHRVEQLDGFIGAMPTPDIYGQLTLDGVRMEFASADQ